jgi:hypothetical protein
LRIRLSCEAILLDDPDAVWWYEGYDEKGSEETRG